MINSQDDAFVITAGSQKWKLIIIQPTSNNSRCSNSEEKLSDEENNASVKIIHCQLGGDRKLEGFT